MINLIPIVGLPLIQPNDNLVEFILASLHQQAITLQAGDALVLAQKIVSKSENRLVKLSEVVPSPQALEIAKQVNKDPRHVEVILQESKEVIWASPGIFVVETQQGYVCANAGVDRSNVSKEDWLCLLPRDPDESAHRLRQEFFKHTGLELAIVINDTHGRPFRMGGVGVALGAAGIECLFDQRGHNDLFGYQLQATLTAIGDELASAASLVMGQANEATPAVLIRGMRYQVPQNDKGAKELIRPKENDVFRYPKPRSDQA